VRKEVASLLMGPSIKIRKIDGVHSPNQRRGKSRGRARRAGHRGGEGSREKRRGRNVAVFTLEETYHVIIKCLVREKK